MAEKPYLLKETNWYTVSNTKYSLAVLPWGATEAHNFHLPYGTDIIETARIAEKSARLAWESGSKSIVLPVVPFGVNTQQLDIKFTINMNPGTQSLVLADVLGSLEGHGIEKLVILNGHGGSDFKQIIRELQNQTDIFICQLDWFRIPVPGGLFEEIGDHAGEMETSLMQHLSPDLVLPLDKAGSGRAKRFSVKAFNEKWAWAPRQWTSVTEDTGVGNPAAATPGKGQKYFNYITAEIAAFLIDLAGTKKDSFYK